MKEILKPQHSYLIELLNNALNKWNCDIQPEKLSHIAEELIDEGVIVPPCQAGDTVYYYDANQICAATVTRLSIFPNSNEYIVYCKGALHNISGETKLAFHWFGESAFLSLEEAEAKLPDWKNKYFGF